MPAHRAAAGGVLRLMGCCSWRGAAAGGVLQLTGCCSWRGAAADGVLRLAGCCGFPSTSSALRQPEPRGVSKQSATQAVACSCCIAHHRSSRRVGEKAEATSPSGEHLAALYSQKMLAAPCRAPDASPRSIPGHGSQLPAPSLLLWDLFRCGKAQH